MMNPSSPSAQAPGAAVPVYAWRTPQIEHGGSVVAAKIAERVGKLEERLKQLKAKQQRVAARKRSVESRRTRRDETRRKILVGAIVLAKVAEGAIAEDQLHEWLESALTRPEDRALFGL
jgi:hypothetical protein